MVYNINYFIFEINLQTVKTIFAILILIGVCSKSSAQTIISGKIKDTKGHPVSNASIALKNTYDGATSDSTGNYHFSTTEKGEQIFAVTSVGYNSFEQKINITSEPIKLDVAIKEQLNELKAVTITAAHLQQAIRNAAQY